jgi:hypothetical protein
MPWDLVRLNDGEDWKWMLVVWLKHLCRECNTQYWACAKHFLNQAYVSYLVLVSGHGRYLLATQRLTKSTRQSQLGSIILVSSYIASWNIRSSADIFSSFSDSFAKKTPHRFIGMKPKRVWPFETADSNVAISLSLQNIVDWMGWI